MILKGDFSMSLHSGMKFRFTKGKMKGRKGTIKSIMGNEIQIRSSKRKYWVNKQKLEDRIQWVK